MGMGERKFERVYPEKKRHFSADIIFITHRNQGRPSMAHQLMSSPCSHSPFTSSNLSCTTPCPSCRPFAHPPSQQLPFRNKYFPFPCRLPSTYSPSYCSPLAHRNTPCPLNCPNFHSPSQLFPFEYCNLPLPSRWLQQKLPSQRFPEWKRQLPWPNFAPYINSPQNLSPFAYSSLPFPCGSDFDQLPSQAQPESQFQNRPCPSALNPRISPAQKHPLRKTKIPKTGLLSFVSPLKISLLGKQSIVTPDRPDCPLLPPRPWTVCLPSARATATCHKSSDYRLRLFPK